MRLDSTYKQREIHRQWEDTYRKDPRLAAYDDAVYASLFRRLRPAGRWLDAGCGTGVHSRRLARMGAEVTGVDISETALEMARQQSREAVEAGTIRFVASPLEDLPKDLDVTNVHCRGVLMHIPDWRTSVANLAAQVKPGGYFVVFEGNSRSLEAAAVRLIRPFVNVKSELRNTDSGLEFWSESDGRPFLVRMFHQKVFKKEVQSHGLRLVFERAHSVLDVNRVPPGIRPAFVSLNRFWHAANLPLASGVVLVFERP